MFTPALVLHLYLQFSEAVFYSSGRGPRWLLQSSAMGICTIFYTRSAWHHGELCPCTMTFQSHQPEVTADLADCHKQDLGSIGTVGVVKPCLQETPSYRSASTCAKGTAKESCVGVHKPVACTKTLKHFRPGSVHIQFWCLGTGTHVDAQGQKAPFLLRKRHPDLMPSKGQP